MMGLWCLAYDDIMVGLLCSNMWPYVHMCVHVKSVLVLFSFQNIAVTYGGMFIHDYIFTVYNFVGINIRQAFSLVKDCILIILVPSFS